ncbi:hypothetical protein M885DRAFT_612538 [Pelagophyceae sp. CCMP2097]|nr:hypothetical protein M885DRAFT_612538 [Pelagophyceae sp. CCMP2097]
MEAPAGGDDARRAAARERMRARAAARRSQRAETDGGGGETASPRPFAAPGASGAGASLSLARMKERRNSLKETARAITASDAAGEGAEGAGDDETDTSRQAPVDAQTLFDVDVDEALVRQQRAPRPFVLDSVFAGDLEYDGSEGADDGEARGRALVHAWDRGVPLRRVVSRLWTHSVAAHMPAPATNVPLPEAPEDDAGDGRGWFARRFSRRGRSASPRASWRDRVPLLRRPGDDENTILETRDVGLYVPMHPPRARVLLELGAARASDRLLYEAACRALDDGPAETSRAPTAAVARALAQKLRDSYFGDGELRVGADPLEHNHQRPPVDAAAEFDGAVQVEPLHEEIRIDADHFGGVADRAKSGELCVSLGRVALYDHPLFGGEDRLYAQLRLLYGEYRRYLEAQRAVYLRKRLETIVEGAFALRKEADRMGWKPASKADAEDDSENSEGQKSATAKAAKAAAVAARDFRLGEPAADDGASVDRAKLALATRHVRGEAFETLALLAAEEQTMAELSQALYTTWNQLKGLRRHQGFVSTPAKLVAINVRLASTEADRAAPALEDQLQALSELVPFFAAHDLSKTEKWLLKVLGSFQAGIAARNRKKEHESNFLLKLYTTVELTRDEDKAIPIGELLRRRRVRQQRVYVVVRAHGNFVAETPTSAVDWPAFTAHFDRELRLKVARRPIELSIELWQRRAFSDLKLASVLVPVPGMASRHDNATVHSLVPVANWFQFASPGVTWDVRLAQGDAVQVLQPPPREDKPYCALKCFRRKSEVKRRLPKAKWEAGVISRVNWSTYDVRSTASGALLKGVRAAQVRRRGAAFETTRKHLTGSALVCVHWAIRDTPSAAPNWALMHVSPGAGRNSAAGYGELAPLPPRPQLDDARLFSGEHRVPAGSSDRYYYNADGSVQPPRRSGGSKSSAALEATPFFDPNDPRNASLLEAAQFKRGAGDTGRFRANELRQRLAFRRPGAGLQKVGAAFDDLLRTTSSTRHRALVLRRAQPSLFSKPIPATDALAQSDAAVADALHREAQRGRLLKASRAQPEPGAAASALRRAALKVSEHLLDADDADEGAGSDDEGEADEGGADKKLARMRAFVDRIQSAAAERGRHRRGAACPVAAVINEGAPIPKLRATAADGALTALQPRRALRPPRRHRAAAASPANDCSILVQIIGASHMPRSSPMGRGTADHGDLLQAISSVDVSRKGARESGTFVVASFQEHRRRTMLAPGSFPRWKETLELPFIPSNGDFSPTNLMQCGDCLRLAVFSETAVPADASADGERVADGARRVYVGEVSVPFTTLYCNGGTEGFVEGVFRLRTPPVQTGVDFDVEGGENDEVFTLNSAAADAPRLFARSQAVAYLHVAIFLRPPLAAPTQAPVYQSAFEDESLLRYGTLWTAQLRLWLETTEDRVKHSVDSRIAKRAIEVFGMDMRGDAVLTCRYLRPQKPPPGVDTPAKAARFVSLIPFLDDWQSFGSANIDVWCTSQEFLDIGAGDWEEHAILLVNYIWWLQLQRKGESRPDDVFLVIGSGMPEGRSVYVMQRPAGAVTADSVVFWNACTGDVCSAADERLALVDVGCVVGADNIWANLQPVLQPARLGYDFGNVEKWRPFYHDLPPERRGCLCLCEPGPLAIVRPKSIATVQPKVLRYSAPDVVGAEQIQNNVADELKRRIRRWRAARGAQHSHTSFSVDFSRRLQNLLPQLEKLHAGGALTAAAVDRHRAEALGASTAWDLDAVTLHFVWTDVGTILEQIRATNIHEHRRNNAQFVVGVYVHPLVSKLFSVWVYYGTITPKRGL